MKGATMLKVTGIIMIVFAAFGIIGCILSLIGMAAISLLVGPVALVFLWLSLLISVVGAVSELIAGINGVKYCNDGAKANVCMLWGGIVAGCCILSSVLTLISYPKNFNIFSLIIGLILPGLYLYGAYQNKNS